MPGDPDRLTVSGHPAGSHRDIAGTEHRADHHGRTEGDPARDVDPPRGQQYQRHGGIEDECSQRAGYHGRPAQPSEERAQQSRQFDVAQPQSGRVDQREEEVEEQQHGGSGGGLLEAALGHDVELSGKRAVCVLSGGNIDVGFIHKVVEKGLVTRGRQMKFQTVMPDIPGSLYRFSEVMVKCGANIIMVQHDRLSTNLAIGDAILHVACEVTSREHGQELIRQLEAAGYRIVMES